MLCSEDQAKLALSDFVAENTCYGSDVIKNMIVRDITSNSAYHVSRKWLDFTVRFVWHIMGSYQIREIASCAFTGNAGNVFLAHRLQRKPLVSDPGVHHGTCVTHVPWCILGSLSCVGGENVPGIPGACATRNFAYLVRGLYGSMNRIIQQGAHQRKH